MTPTRAYWKGRPVVYRVYDRGGRLIYIGASHELPARFRGHELTSWWYGLIGRVRVQVFPTRFAALAAEAVAIQEEQPVFNSKHTGRPEGDVSHWTADDIRTCAEWRNAAPGRNGFMPRGMWEHLAAVAA